MPAGDTLLIFLPCHNEPPASGVAPIDNRNQHPTLDFVKTANCSAVFTGIMPRHYSAGGITANLHWTAEETAGDVDWDGSFESMASPQDIDADGFAAVQSTNDNAVPGTSGVEAITAIAFTNEQIDGILVGGLFRFKVTRDAASDTAEGTVELLAVELRETP